MKKIFVLLITAVFLLLSSCSEEETAPAEMKNYGSVGGEAITAEEIEYFRTRDRSDIINEFASEYNITDFSDFWNNEYEGASPADALEERALSDAKDAKTRLILMKEKGIYDTCSFAGLKEKAEQYNEEHGNDKSTVGINTIDIDSFYTYYISTGEMELKNILAEDELKPTDDEIKEKMSSNPDLTEQGAISVIVDERYEDFISEYAAKLTKSEG